MLVLLCNAEGSEDVRRRSLGWGAIMFLDNPESLSLARVDGPEELHTAPNAGELAVGTASCSIDAGLISQSAVPF